MLILHWSCKTLRNTYEIQAIKHSAFFSLIWTQISELFFYIIFELHKLQNEDVEMKQFIKRPKLPADCH